MEALLEFIDSGGFPITVRAEQIVHVASPTIGNKGGFNGELTLTTGAKWGFGGPDRHAEYRKALAAFEAAHALKREGV